LPTAACIRQKSAAHPFSEQRPPTAQRLGSSLPHTQQTGTFPFISTDYNSSLYSHELLFSTGLTSYRGLFSPVINHTNHEFLSAEAKLSEIMSELFNVTVYRRFRHFPLKRRHITVCLYLLSTDIFKIF